MKDDFNEITIKNDEEASVPATIPAVVMRETVHKLIGNDSQTGILSCPTWEQFIGILLLYFRFLTSEMLKYLCPWCSGSEIGMVKKRLEGKGYSFIEATRYNGCRTVYSLSQEGLRYFRKLLQEKELKEARIPRNIGSVRNDKLWHDTDLRTVLCAHIRGMIKTTPKWYTSIELFAGVSPEQSIQKSIEGIADTDQTDSSSKKIISDAVMSLAERVVLVEQDTGSQMPQVIREKFASYAAYLNTLDSQSYQLLFNVCSHTGSEVRVKTKKTICKNIGDLMLDNSCACLGEAYIRITHLLSANPRRYRYQNMLLLLEDFFIAGGSRDAGIKELYEFLGNHKPSNSENENRVQTIKTAFKTVFGENEELKKAVYNGFSVSVTSDIYRTAYYINPYDSGLMDELICMINKQYPPESRVQKYRSLGNFNNAIAVRVNETAALFVVNEISADIAGYIRMSSYLSGNWRNKYPLHILLIVASEKEAKLFAEETGCIGRYCSRDDIRKPDEEFNITIRFMTYADGGMGLNYFFIPDMDGSMILVDDI